MLLFSKPDFAEEGKPTVFAIVESILMTTISLAIAVQFYTLTHIAISACVVPFLLLRSENSTKLGLNWFNRFVPKKKSENIILEFWRSIYIIFLALFIRILATVVHLSDGIPQIPSNWFRVVCCTDVSSKVEFVPGSGNIKDTIKSYASEFVFFDFEIKISPFMLFISPLFIIMLFSVIISYYWIIYPNYNINVTLILFPFSFILFSLLAIGFVFSYVFASYYYAYIITCLYRLGLKSTALIWFPLIFATRSDPKLSLERQLSEIQQLGRWKVVRWVSWIIIGLFIIRVSVLPFAIDWWNSQTWTGILNVYIASPVSHSWHAASAINAFIFILTYYYVIQPAPGRIADGVWSKGFVGDVLQKTAFWRGVISVYTVFVGVCLTVLAATSAKWPHWSWSILPQ